MLKIPNVHDKSPNYVYRSSHELWLQSRDTQLSVAGHASECVVREITQIVAPEDQGGEHTRTRVVPLNPRTTSCVTAPNEPHDPTTELRMCARSSATAAAAAECFIISGLRTVHRNAKRSSLHVALLMLSALH